MCKGGTNTPDFPGLGQMGLVSPQFRDKPADGSQDAAFYDLGRYTFAPLAPEHAQVSLESLRTGLVLPKVADLNLL